MNILFLSTWYPYPPDNGSKLRVWHLLKALATRHRVTLLSFAFDTAQPAQPSALQTWCEQVETVNVNPYTTNRAGTLHTFLSLRPVVSRPIPAMTACVDTLAAQESFDAVISSTLMMVDYALRLPAPTVLILEEHNSMTRWAWERFQRQSGLLSRLRGQVSYAKARRYDIQTMRRFALNVMVSEQDRAVYYQSLPEGQVAVVPNGVDCTHNRPGLATPQPGRLVYNGALTHSANYDAMHYFLSDIWPIIRAAEPHSRLSITGSTQGVELNGLALDEQVTLTGYVPDVRIPVAEAQLCVVPLRDGGGTRLKILEAMALGTPVVATSKGAEGIDAVDGEHLLIADTPAAFAAATVRLMQDGELHAQLAANARRLVEDHYDWEQIGVHFVDLVEEAVALRRSI